MIRARRTAAIAWFTFALLASFACKNVEQPPATPEPAPAAPAAAVTETELVVFAAASLREVFDALGGDFERSHPGVHVTFNFAGTQELRTQLEHGASVDVFASADQRHMQELAQAKRVRDPQVFARNEPVMVVATGRAETLRAFADLARAERIVVGTPEVPIGRYTLLLLDRAGQTLGAEFRAKVEAHIVSRELNVRQVLAKVVLAEADAGIVYRTDVISAKGKVSLVPIPSEINVLAEYPMAAVTGAPHPGLAREWLALVSSAAGRDALQRAGFLPPAAAGDIAQPAAKP